jgi:hypothetical protein
MAAFSTILVGVISGVSGHGATTFPPPRNVSGIHHPNPCTTITFPTQHKTDTQACQLCMSDAQVRAVEGCGWVVARERGLVVGGLVGGWPHACRRVFP